MVSRPALTGSPPPRRRYRSWVELTPEQAQSLLAEPQVAVIAINAPGRPPLATPIWYDYAPGGDLTIVTSPESLKARRLRAAGGCTMVVDTVTPKVRYVSVECDLVAEEAPDPDFTRRMAARYLPGEAVEGIVQVLGPEARFTLRPVRWRSADLSF